MCASLGDGSASFCGASYFIPQPQDAEYIKQFQTIWLNLRCTHNRDWISLPAKGALRLHRDWPEEKVTKSDFREQLWLDLKIYCYTPTTNLNAPSLPQCDASSFQTGCLWRQWGANLKCEAMSFGGFIREKGQKGEAAGKIVRILFIEPSGYTHLCSMSHLWKCFVLLKVLSSFDLNTAKQTKSMLNPI